MKKTITIAKFWDNSESHHGKLLWEGLDPKTWEHWEAWVNATGKKDPFINVSLQYTKVK
jgi:hypothetical protein